LAAEVAGDVAVRALDGRSQGPGGEGEEDAVVQCLDPGTDPRRSTTPTRGVTTTDIGLEGGLTDG
jgi:hypothetical protein